MALQSQAIATSTPNAVKINVKMAGPKHLAAKPPPAVVGPCRVTSQLSFHFKLEGLSQGTIYENTNDVSTFWVSWCNGPKIENQTSIR